MRDHNVEEAIRLLSEAAKEQPDNHEIWAKLGSLYLERGRPDGFTEVIETMFDAMPYRPQVHHLVLAGVGVKQGFFQQARSAFDDAIRKQPDNVKLLYGLSVLLQAGDHHAESVPYLTQALDLVPDLRVGHYALAVAFLTLGRLDEADHESMAAVRGDRADARMAEAYYVSGVIEEMKGLNMAARLDFEMFIKMAAADLEDYIRDARWRLQYLS